MYHPKKIVYQLILFLMVQIKVSDNIVNAEAQSSMYGLKHLTNEQNEPGLCDQCMTVIITCLQSHSACERIICMNKACQSCFKNKSSDAYIKILQNQDLQLDSEIIVRLNDHVSSEEILPTEGFHQPMIEVQNPNNEFEENRKSVDNETQLENQLGNNSNSSIDVYFGDNPFIHYTIVGFTFTLMTILIVLTLLNLFAPGVEFLPAFGPARTFVKRPRETDIHFHTTPVENPPPPYEQCAKEKCTLVPMEVDDSQLKAESA